MARTLEFDRTRALEQAMKVFWARGYTATSLAQLLEAMNIARSSFYSTFGDKRSLFSQCLELFARRTLAILDSPAIEEKPQLAPAFFFHKTLLGVSKQRCQHGCMMVNTILELADVDPALGKQAAEGLARIEQRFEALLARASGQDALSANVSPAALAQYIMNVNQGLRVQSRKRIATSQLRAIADISLAMAGLVTIDELIQGNSETGHKGARHA